MEKLPVGVLKHLIALVPDTYGAIAELSKTHYGALSGDLARFKDAACRHIRECDGIDEVCIREYGVLPNGRRHGIYRTYYSDGAIRMVANYDDGKLDGMCVKYYESGAVSYEAFYVADALHGTCGYWDETGVLRDCGEYDHGRRHGVAAQYDPTGAKVCETKYLYDDLVSTTKYDANGSLLTYKEYKN